jgi:hypothetical protein
MSTIDLPGFPADASLYETGGQYRTCVDGSGRPTGHMGTIRLSAIDVPGEVIEIEDDAPWSPPSWGGHTGPGSSGGSGETGPGGGGPGGGDGGMPQDTKNPPRPRFKPRKDGPCNAFVLYGPDIREGRLIRPAQPGPLWACCGKNAKDRNVACVGCQPSGDDGRCHNGWLR